MSEQDARRDWIIANWPHIVELEQVTQIISTQQAAPHWPDTQPDPVRTMAPTESDALHLELVNIGNELRQARSVRAAEQAFNRYIPTPSMMPGVPGSPPSRHRSRVAIRDVPRSPSSHDVFKAHCRSHRSPLQWSRTTSARQHSRGRGSVLRLHDEPRVGRISVDLS